jgi:small subunit ribosomal protein S1
MTDNAPLPDASQHPDPSDAAAAGAPQEAQPGDVRAADAQSADESDAPAYDNQRVRIGSQRQADARFRAEVTAPQRRFRPPQGHGKVRDLTGGKIVNPPRGSEQGDVPRPLQDPETPKPVAAKPAPIKPAPIKPAPIRPAAPKPPAQPTAEEISAATAALPEIDSPPADAATTDVATGSAPVPTLASKVAETVTADRPSRGKTPLPSDLQGELDEFLAGVSLDEVISGAAPVAAAELEPDSRYRGRVAKIHRDDVFIDLGGRNQGIVPLHNFAKEPEIGQMLDVVVRRFLPEEGLYEINVPGASVNVQDWSSLSEGIIVDAMVTGHNKGGLECEVNKIRGFIPAGQASIYRVEDLSQFVGQKMACVVTEANEDRRNLVLSRRAVLEREQAEQKQKLMAELEVGQIREGIVRRVTDFGAFVDLGGVDGLIHISQMSWDRIKHASEVVAEGQKVKVKVEKIDPETGKIGLSYRDQFENPWLKASQKYPQSSVVKGTVSRIMDFGAFVKLEPGIEGLVHISELSHKRVFRVGDVLSEGQQIEVLVTSIDPDAQRISLSLKALQAKPLTEKEKLQQEEEAAEAAAPPAAPIKKSNAPLKGGLGSTSEGAKFGLKW